MTKIYCENCGCKIDRAVAYEYDGDCYCEDCFDDLFTTCDECGEVVWRDDAYYVDGYVLCNDCVESNCAYCYECDEYHFECDMHYLERYARYVCEDCFDRYYYCSDCGDYVAEDDWDFDNDCCTECADERRANRVIKPYHWHKDCTPIFYGDASMTLVKKMFIGVEWEITGDREVANKLADILGERAYFEDDCSVNGFECIFQPHTYEELKYNDAIKKAFECAYDNGMTGDNAGLHIHISRDAFGETEDEIADNIAKVCVLHNEGYGYDNMVKLSRREERRADQWASSFHWAKECASDMAWDYADGFRGSHGVAINCSNRRTVEFRLGKSTVDYDEFMAWVDTIVTLVQRCKTMDIRDASNFDAWFVNASDSVKSYMESRGVEWCEPVMMTVDNYSQILETVMQRYNELLLSNGANTMDFNTMLTTMGVNAPTRRALGYM